MSDRPRPLDARWTPGRVAVLGAGGFLGSHLVPALWARFGRPIDAVDVTFDKLPPMPEGSVTRIRARVETPGLLDELTARCDLVISLTALCNPALYNTDPVRVIDASYTDLVPLVNLCAARRRWLLHLSTCEVYGRMALDGDGQALPAMDEERTALFLGPVQRERWSYACAKQLLERLIWAHGTHGALPFTIVRPFNVIGPRMDFVQDVDGEGVPRVLASFMGALMRGEPLPLVDGGHQRRSFLYVDDFVDALLRLIERRAACDREILNVGHPDNDISVRTLAERLREVYARFRPRAPLSRLEEVSAESLYGRGYDDSRERVPDVTKARRLLGWQPRASLDDMLPPIVADYLARYEPVLAQLRVASR